MNDAAAPLRRRKRPPRRPRLTGQSFNKMLPNLMTLVGLCVGLSAIRMAMDGHFGGAVIAIAVSGIIDGLDGRLARLLRATSRFGAEFDSLADFLCFGVAPALVLYLWSLNDWGAIGFLPSLMFASAMALRLARFNAAIDNAPPAAFAYNFFTGVPAPAGAITVLLPIYLSFLGLPQPPAMLTAAYTLLIAFLMVSRLPVFSGKTWRMRVPPEMVLPVFVGVIFFIALLIGYPWYILSAGSVLYLLSLPAGWKSYRDHERRAAASGVPASADAAPASSAPFAAVVPEPHPDDRPTRLN